MGWNTILILHLYIITLSMSLFVVSHVWHSQGGLTVNIKFHFFCIIHLSQIELWTDEWMNNIASPGDWPKLCWFYFKISITTHTSTLIKADIVMSLGQMVSFYQGRWNAGYFGSPRQTCKNKSESMWPWTPSISTFIYWQQVVSCSNLPWKMIRSSIHQMYLKALPNGNKLLMKKKVHIFDLWLHWL